MSDIIIPMASDPRGHDMHDDCADFAVQNYDPNRPFIPQGCDQQGRHAPTIEPDPANAVMGMDDYSEADKDQSRLVTVIMFIAVWCLALPAAWLFISHIVSTIVESAP